MRKTRMVPGALPTCWKLTLLLCLLWHCCQAYINKCQRQGPQETLASRTATTPCTTTTLKPLGHDHLFPFVLLPENWYFESYCRLVYTAFVMVHLQKKKIATTSIVDTLSIKWSVSLFVCSGLFRAENRRVQFMSNCCNWTQISPVDWNLINILLKIDGCN